MNVVAMHSPLLETTVFENTFALPPIERGIKALAFSKTYLAMIFSTPAISDGF
jgi:hypothetical protein